MGRLGAVSVLDGRVNPRRVGRRDDELPQDLGDDRVLDAARGDRYPSTRVRLERLDYLRTETGLDGTPALYAVFAGPALGRLFRRDAVAGPGLSMLEGIDHQHGHELLRDVA